MTPEDWALGPMRPKAILVGHAAARRSPLPVSPVVLGFTEGAVADAAARATRCFGVPIHPVALEPQALLDAARALRVGALVTGYAPIGPAAEGAVARQGGAGRFGYRPRAAAPRPRRSRLATRHEGLLRLPQAHPRAARGGGAGGLLRAGRRGLPAPRRARASTPRTCRLRGRTPTKKAPPSPEGAFSSGRRIVPRRADASGGSPQIT